MLQDGAFFMPFEEFVGIFSIEVCSVNATHPVAVTVRGEWEGGRTSGGRWRDTTPVGIWTSLASFLFAPNQTIGAGPSSFNYNPRFRLRVKCGQRCYLTLEQSDIRRLTHTPGMATEHALDFPVACLYLLVGDNEPEHQNESLTQPPIEILRL